MVDQIMALPQGTRFNLLSPLVRGRKGEYRKELSQLRKDGFVRVIIDGKTLDLADEIVLDKNKKHDIDIVVDRLIVKEGMQRRLADSLEVALNHAEGIVKVAILEDSKAEPPANKDDGKKKGLKSSPVEPETLLFSETLACIDCGISYPEMTPRMFSFNNPYGACPDCTGLGTRMYFDPDLVVPNPDLSLREGAIAPWEKRLSGWFHQTLEALAKAYDFDIRTPFKSLSPMVQKIILSGSGRDKVEFWWERTPGANTSTTGNSRGTQQPGASVPGTDSNWWEDLEKYMNVMPCPTCHGARLKKEALFVRIAGSNICDVTALSINDALNFFNTLTLSAKDEEIARRILKEIRERLHFLVNVGLDYLSLDRTAGTLSGGEGQRIRLATQIGSSLVGVLYILDEPSIGLHQRDNARLLQTLKHLRDIGNTVLVVEHDEETILEADYVIDMGPGAGVHGGEVVAQGTPAEVMGNPDSLTGKYLSGVLSIPVPKQRRTPQKFLRIIGALENNLKDVEVDIPLGIMTCVTGVSGSGKSTLIIDTLYKALCQRLYRSRERAGEFREIKGLEALDKVINIDQSPIGRTPRSNPATYTGVFADIRDIFAQLPESKVRGYKPGRYSFNVKGGRCEACSGDGIIKIEMHFLPDVYVQCEVCKGARYNRETLEVLFKGKSIADVLDMTVSQAVQFMENIPRNKNKLKTLDDVGLGYIKLGQSATTLSGGEAQRVKLAKELSKRATGRTIYILDEPTTGLHFADIQKLLEVLERLVESGNTIVIIEHNLDVIKTADYIIDLGPEGGARGGEVIATGSPEEVARVTRSYTGQYLRKLL
jgi:excinuclease ABC subunit A